MKVLHWGQAMTRAGCPSVVRDGHITLYLVSDRWGNHIRETKRILYSRPHWVTGSPQTTQAVSEVGSGWEVG